jgi:2-dehydropantoate 2-reductase
MKILVLGAGAIGGYFGARLVQAGGDVAFLVRERRAAQLRAHGLVVRSPHGDFQVPAVALLQSQLRAPFDLVIVACKAYDLEAAIEDIRSAVGPGTLVLPLLNGIAHIERLQQAFGADRVVGGSCGIPATLSPGGEVIQIAPLHRIVFGPLPESSAGAPGRLRELEALFRRTPVETVLAADIWQELWEKFAGLATIASMTCLMRAAIGDILAAEEGARWSPRPTRPARRRRVPPATRRATLRRPGTAACCSSADPPSPPRCCATWRRAGRARERTSWETCSTGSGSRGGCTRTARRLGAPAKLRAPAAARGRRRERLARWARDGRLAP